MEASVRHTAHAHSANSAGHRHSLREHLSCVAALAADFAQPATWQSEARLAGLLHDLGKYGDLFQRRLDGLESGLDHWSAGAFVAGASFGTLAAAVAIEGHHIGLQPALPAFFFARLRDIKARHPLGLRLSEADFTLLRQRAELDGLKFEAPSRRILDATTPLKPDRNVAPMLDIRMLFSCLTDADFLDTEAHFQGDANGKRRREPGPVLQDHLSDAIQALDAHLSSKARHAGKSSDAVAQVRADLWQAVCQAATGSTGLFTLTAPTGSGKTLAMLKFALDHARANGLRRVVLAVPYLSIIEQTAREYRKVFAGLGDHFVLEHHSLAGLGEEKTRTDAEESKQDTDAERQRRLLAENWDAPIILTTNVQLLESLFSNRPSANRKLHRLMESVILFDEAQSLPQNLTLPTLSALSHLATSYRSSIVFATATQPAFDHLDTQVQRQASRGWRPIEIVTEHDTMFYKLKRVQVEWPAGNDQITWDELATRLRRQDRALCIVNLKRHAHTLTKALAGEEGLFHLSTNLCTAHRREVLDSVRARLESPAPLRCLLISTQCVEAGVDVDFPAVYRAMAPLEAIAQAAGRCNREGRMSSHGQVTVFQPVHDGDLRALFPTHAYFQAAMQTVAMLADRGALDIHDPVLFRDYYRQLFDLAKPEAQNPDLILAISELDFPEVARRYRLIDADAIQVVVPWLARIDEYETLRKQAMHGIDRAWMKRAQALAVGVYRPKPGHPAWGFLVPANFRPRAGRSGSSNEWFVLEDNNRHDPERRLYDDTLGLRLPDSQRIMIA